MGCDMVVAHGRATADGRTRLGQNLSSNGGDPVELHRSPGRAFAPGETVAVPQLRLPQARETYTAVGCRPARCWGYSHGLNEHGVAAGCASFRTKLLPPQPGLTGTDLVRLLLERSRSARQAVDLLSDLLERHGQGHPDRDSGHGADHGFVVADGTQAFVVETAANHWVCQEILQVRAVSNVCTVRQDWDRISRGLGGHAIGQGWWPADGSKLDFAEALGDSPIGQASALRRWGRATLLLEQQNGHIDTPFLRRLLADHYEGTSFEIDPFGGGQVPLPLCRHADERGSGTAASLVAEVDASGRALPLLQCAFGPPCLSVYLPIFLDGDLPPGFAGDHPEGAHPSLGWRLRALADRLRNEPGLRSGWRDRLSSLQADVDQASDEFAAEAATLKHRDDRARLRHAAAEFMQRRVDQLESALAELLADTRGPRPFHAIVAGR